MQKKLIYLLFILLTGISCSDNLEQTNTGYLKMPEISIDTDVEIQELSRSTVASDIQIDIYQGSTIIKTYLVGDPALNAPIVLPIGNYKLVAHTPNMAEAPDQEAGTPIYYAESNFMVETNETTIVPPLVAKQINIGIYLQLTDQLFNTAFTSITCHLLSSSGRTVNIDCKNNTAITYFNLYEDGNIQYTIKATNTDGEDFILDTKTISMDRPQNYYIVASIEK